MWRLGERRRRRAAAARGLLHRAAPRSFFLGTLLARRRRDRRAGQLLRRLDEGVRAAPRLIGLSASRRSGRRRVYCQPVPAFSAAGRRPARRRQVFHWRQPVPLLVVAEARAGGAAARGFDGGGGPRVLHLSRAELAHGGQGHEDAAAPGAGQSMVADAKSPHPCPTATEDASRAVRVARGRWGRDHSRNPFGRWHLRGTRTRASHESISLIASARHRYVQGWGYDVIPPRSLAMGAVGIVDVCVPLLREKVVCAQRAPRATPPRARRGRGREEGLPRRPGRRPSPARPPRRPGGACAASTSPVVVLAEVRVEDAVEDRQDLVLRLPDRQRDDDERGDERPDHGDEDPERDRSPS